MQNDSFEFGHANIVSIKKLPGVNICVVDFGKTQKEYLLGKHSQHAHNNHINELLPKENQHQ